MKILRSYFSDDWAWNDNWHTKSPLMKAIRASYDLTELVFERDYDEKEYAEILRQYDVVIANFASLPIPDEMADNPGNLKYICNLGGGVGDVVSLKIIESPHFVITNWGDAPAYSVAEGAFALLCAVMKDIPLAIDHVQNGGLGPAPDRRPTSLHFTRVGIYGMGVIGRKFVEFIRPFMPEMFAYDPYVENMPEGVTRVNSLEELFSKSQILVIHAALCEETEGSVTKELLAMLPDGAILINTARGKILDQEALYDELKAGRLRAGLDVIFPGEWPEEGSPLRYLKNAIFTGHYVSAEGWWDDPEELTIVDNNCLDNLKRFKNGEPLKFIMDPIRFKRST